MKFLEGIKDKTGKLYVLEQQRVESFKLWPFGSEDACSIEKMAQAGFYWCGNEQEIDSVVCFLCGKTLDGWEATDDPWSEHLKHAPQCLFAKQSKPEKEYTLEEFVNLCGNVIKNYIRQQADICKKNIRKTAEVLLNDFSKTNKS